MEIIYTVSGELDAISLETRRVMTIEVSNKAVEKILSERVQQKSQHSAISRRKVFLHTLTTNWVRKRRYIVCGAGCMC